MLRVSVRSVGKVTVFRCQGRIVTGGEAMRLRDAVLFRIEAGTSVLDLAEVESIDAGGLGLLIDLRNRTQARGIQLKLANITRRVRELLELTSADRILEIDTTREPYSFSVPVALRQRQRSADSWPA